MDQIDQNSNDHHDGDDHVEAKHVYVLLTDRYRISRNIRVEWFLDNLNKNFPSLSKRKLTDFQNEIDIISFVTSSSDDNKYEFQTTTTTTTANRLEQQQQQQQNENCKFRISCDTKFTFFSRKYCFVFILDMSTSVANVDIQHSTILTDELYDVLAKCLTNIVKPFYVPGSKFLFQPEIYLTIVAYLPFYSLDVNNVIVHGFKLTMDNIDRLLQKVFERIYYYIELLSQNICSENFHDQYVYRQQWRTIVPANLSLINMIRFGLLSLNLLPENSHQGIVIVTDGNTSFSDAHTLESALAQLRLSMISCSFIHIGSPPHPDSALGYVPYIDFMNFISQATFGAYLSISSDYDDDDDQTTENNNFNVFHRAFFVYSFNHGRSSFTKCLRSRRKSSSSTTSTNIWVINNPYFYSNQDDDQDNNVFRNQKKDQQLLRRKQLENQINANFSQILSYRLREGFTIKRVNLKQSENIIEISLTLPWRHNVNIEYHISAYFHRNNHNNNNNQNEDIGDDNDENFTNYEVIVESNYNFLHDASCQRKMFKSQLRSTTIKQFCSTIKHFNDSNNLGIHFHHFARNEIYRSIPESMRNGVSLFYLQPNSNVPEVSVPNELHLKFAQYWKPICMLDVNMCQKSSLHTHQINILLKHDYPLPEYLFHPNQFGRYETIQCKQTMSVLNVVLKEWSSFVLLENHSYIKLIKENDDDNDKSYSFYLIRIIAQPPCLVLHLAFIGGTSGSLRNQIVNNLSKKLRQYNNNDQMKATTSGFVTITSNKRNSSNNNSLSVNCFVILNRPIERMLIRYEKIPKDFYSCYKYEEDLRTTQLTSYASLNMFQTLVRFLYHQRFIWSTTTTTNDPGQSTLLNNRLDITSISKILSVLTFNVFDDEDGNMVDHHHHHRQRHQNQQQQQKNDDLIDDKLFGQQQQQQHLIVTECWIEPQNGNAYNNQLSSSSANNQHQQQDNKILPLTYDRISSSFYERDFELVSVLLTYEYLVTSTSSDRSSKITCSRQQNQLPNDDDDDDDDYHSISIQRSKQSSKQRFKHIPFKFNLLSLLDKSQLALIKFRTLYQWFNISNNDDDGETPDPNNCTNIMLYSEFIYKISHLYDEIDFNHEETICLIRKTNERLSRKQRHCSNDDNHGEHGVNNNESLLLFSHLDQLQKDQSIRFRCFCKRISSDCIIIILLPSSYKVIRRLTFIEQQQQEKINKKLIYDDQHENVNNENNGQRYASLIIPIIVHKITFQSLTNILLNNPNLNEYDYYSDWNILFDFTNDCLESQQAPPVSMTGQHYYYGHRRQSLNNDQHQHQQQQSKTTIEEIALELFAQSIEILYRNSFTDAIYKSLRYEFNSDDRDIRLVLEKICHKTFDYVDITDFLIYTCEHMKPVINAYFERFPNNNIFDLLTYVARIVDIDVNDDDHNDDNNDNNDNNDHSNILTLRLSSTTSSNDDDDDGEESSKNSNQSCNHNELLRQNFLNLIQSQFTLIQTPPSNSYYYYDYENIQTKKFTLDAEMMLKMQKDAKKKKELLIEFYTRIDNGKIDLAEFYEKVKNSSKFFDQDFVLLPTSSNPMIITQMMNDDDIIDDIDVDIDTETIETNNVNNDDDGDLFNKDPSLFQSLFLTRPFFIGFFYSITLKNDQQIRKISSIPTCLMDIISKTTNSQNCIELETFRVLLNIEIITQALEPEEISSNCSVISGGGGGIGTNNGNINDQMADNIEQSVPWNKLLDTFQVYKYFEFFHQIKWMIRDEIVSLSHNLFQICPKTLEMVVEHIKHTCKSNLSFFERMELKFVFPLDEYPDFFIEFRNELGKLEFSTFCLCELETITDEQNRQNYAALYFHSRQNIYLYGSEIFKQLKKCLEFLCKKFNQKFLLERLFETKICDDLLISKEDQDPFSKNCVRSTLNITPIINSCEGSLNYDFDYDYDNITMKILRTNFQSGSFHCNVVWYKHFPLHRRLHSLGLNTIRSVLNSFVISNRNNLFVYREKSNAIFYVRMYEIECNRDSFSDNFEYNLSSTTTDDLDEMNDYYYYDNIIVPIPLNSTIITTTTTATNEDCESNNRYESDNDSVNSLNVNRSTTTNICIPQQCILMNVHGITEPSNEIKEDMVAALQRKLDEAILDSLIMMLVRNPHSKLTSQDVCFIQGRNSQLKNFHFIINESYYPYINNLKGYIRQNLSLYFYNPKYLDRNPDYHFKLFIKQRFHCVKDEDIFLFHCQEESGKDTKGIACIIFSIVSRDQSTLSLDLLPKTFQITTMDINDFVGGYFDYLVTVYNPVCMNENLNVKFFINFQLWYAGKIDIKFLNQKLRTVIVNSLWEFNLEFKVFKLCQYDDQQQQQQQPQQQQQSPVNPSYGSMSEPSTPKKQPQSSSQQQQPPSATQSEKRERRSGLSNVSLSKPPLLQIGDGDDDNTNFNNNKFGQSSSSNIIEHLDNQENYFNFSNIESVNGSSQTYQPSASPYNHSLRIQDYRQKELNCLANFLRIAIKPWLDYGKQIGVQSISRLEFRAQMKRSIMTIVKEFSQSDYIQKFANDMRMHMLSTSSSGLHYYDFDQFLSSTANQTNDANTDDNGSNTYMILLRHESLWKTRYLHQTENSFVQNYIRSKMFTNKFDMNKFEFLPCFYNPYSTINSASIGVGGNTNKSMNDSNLALNTSDEKLIVYLYNWNTNMNKTIIDWFSKMFLWHNARSLLLKSLILQKAGIFHNTPFKPYNENKDQLISRLDFLLFETKNYDYIFSPFVYHLNEKDPHHNHQQRSNLFDLFLGQFNSDYNVYIRDLKEISKVWQIHGTKHNYPTMDKIIYYVKSYGRLNHYCLTPFLFSHKWRFIISLIRDHTLLSSSLSSLQQQQPRIRHMSGGNILRSINHNENEFIFTGKQRNRRKSGPPNMLENTTTSLSSSQSHNNQTATTTTSILTNSNHTTSDESLDMLVCPHYIQEYVQYLQSLGFSSIKSQKVVSFRKNLDFELTKQQQTYGYGNRYKYSNVGSGRLKSNYHHHHHNYHHNHHHHHHHNHHHQNKNEYEKFYLIKTVIGGFYLFEIGFAEPFVYSYLYSMDSKRFYSWTKNNSNSNMINFLDELDSIKVRMHLHSFTYDYHLRTIHSFISGRQLFQPGYHLISFLDDFIRYYQKAPNYARNHVYTDNIIFESQKITADQLYNYLIKHNQNYGINVFSMNTTNAFDQMTGMNEEYVLIRLSTHRIPFIDENNIQQEDNFDVALLIANQKMNNARILKPRQLCLKFYLLLTSQRELFPKLYSVRYKGQFKTIRMLNNGGNSDRSSSSTSTTMIDVDDIQSKINNNKSILIHNVPVDETVHNSIDRSIYMGICDEKINYLGYFNAHEIVMLEILEQKVKEIKKYLEETIKTAEIDCSRDCLWNNLMGSLMMSNESQQQITMDDFDELLSLVKSIRLDEYDSSLMQFNSFNSLWYRTLAQKLEFKFDNRCRKFHRNTSSFKMAILEPNCKDCFILYHWKNATPFFVEFRIVFNQPPSTIIDQNFFRRCDSGYHVLIEDFVNACTAHMWTMLLS
ncbi:hypothetical protein DERP_006526 [Dermatophagoides pteronyssinus]|uniref:KICSTOR complex protein SZT2-like n=1 Tax=Dermatophagoides pteronyssinus TaxID=6956 RepID=A0ABQ8IQG6_DERPT|nr:hypothetical protein DERP_006526 [Dermatophagoides pteronyssinus]